MNNEIIKNEWGELNLQNQIIVDQYIKEIANKTNPTYMITVARDGEEPVRSVIFYDNAIEAVKVFDTYQDWGFANNFLTVVLYEPNGKQHKKVLKRPPGIEASFMRQQYIELTKILLDIKDEIKISAYQKLVVDIAELLKRDNKRFDEQRFFITTKCFVEE